MVKTISREELKKKKVDEGRGLILIDTMAEMYYRHSHLPGAINLPVDEVRERARTTSRQGRRDRRLLR